MKRIIMIALLILFAWLQPVSAEFYRYKDRHGNTIYTDDLSKVPKDQREQVKSYHESKYRPPQATEKEEQKDKTLSGDASDAELNRLKQQEEALNRERETLKSERDRLNKEKEEAVTPEQIKEYNRSIVDFNARIQAYEEKRDAYAVEVKKYKAEKDAKKNDKPQE